MTQLEKRLLITLAILWFGLEALSTLGDGLQTWTNFVSNILASLNLEKGLYTSIYPIAFCVPLPLVLLMLGYVTWRLRAIYLGYDTKSDEGNNSQESGQAADLSKPRQAVFLNTLGRSVRDALYRKPEWFLMLVAMLFALSVLRLNLPI